MSTQPSHCPASQRGIVLVSSLLLLIVVTLLALSMFRSFGIEEKIAGNTREKQRALQAAESAQHYAEWWLSSAGNASNAPVQCTDLLSANINQGQICSNILTVAMGGAVNVANVPWQINGQDVGVTYVPGNMTIGAATLAAPNNYAAAPRFYISDLGLSADPGIPGEIYQVDAVGYGGNSNTAAVVESTYAVYVSSRNTTL